MKKLNRVLLTGLALMTFGALKSHAQIEVSVRPVVPRAYVVVNRPAAPSPAHVWVAEGWKWDGAHYVYRPGYWAMPPRPRAVWMPGHWRETRRHGNIWIEGHWA